MGLIGKISLFGFCIFLTGHMLINAAASNAEYEQEIIDFSITSSEGDTLKWELQAVEALVQNSKNRAFLQKVNLNYFLLSGQHAVIKSKKAEVDLSSSLISLQGQVRTESPRGMVLETESLLWDGSQKTISTQDYITIKDANFELSGQGLNADLELEKITIRSHAKTIIY